MAPVILLVVIELYFTQRTESVGRSFVHEMTIPAVGKTRVEWRKYRASILIWGVIGGKVRIGQWAWIAGGRKLGGLSISMPDTTTDSVAMLEVFNPAGARLKLVLRNPECLGDIPGLIADQRVGKRNILRDCSGR